MRRQVLKTKSKTSIRSEMWRVMRFVFSTWPTSSRFGFGLGFVFQIDLMLIDLLGKDINILRKCVFWFEFIKKIFFFTKYAQNKKNEIFWVNFCLQKQNYEWKIRKNFNNKKEVEKIVKFSKKNIKKISACLKLLNISIFFMFEFMVLK